VLGVSSSRLDYFSDSDLARIGTAPDHLHTRFAQMLRKLSTTPRMSDGLTIPVEIPTNENRKAESR